MWRTGRGGDGDIVNGAIRPPDKCLMVLSDSSGDIVPNSSELGMMSPELKSCNHVDRPRCQAYPQTGEPLAGSAHLGRAGGSRLTRPKTITPSRCVEPREVEALA